MAAVTLSEVAKMTGGVVVGDGSRTIEGVCSPEDPHREKLCVVWESGILGTIPTEVPVLSGIGTLAGRDGIELKNPRASLVALLAYFDTRSLSCRGIHPTAILSENCRLGEGVVVGPGCVVSSGAAIGDGTILQGSVFVGTDVLVGENCRIEAGVILQDQVKLGDRVTVHSGTVIGCDGFGFVPGPNREWIKIPQIGTVVVEDDVEIGANSTVDRATFGVTRIRRGAKLGNIVHVAHNCDVGEDCLMVGMVGLGGSVKIGNSSVLAGMAGVADHVTIGRGVTVGGRAGVTKEIPDGLTVSGFPAQDHKEEFRLQASLRRVKGYSERIRKLERELEELKKTCTGETEGP